MNRITSRIYEEEKDLQIILDLTARIRPREHRNDYPIKVDLEENLASTTTQANTRLWFDNGQPIGWAYVDGFNNLRWELDRQYEELIGGEIVEWGESCLRKTLAKGETASLDVSCREDYTERIRFLNRFGFSQTEGITVAMSRPLREPILEPTLPQGFFIRPIAGTHEAEAVARMHRAAFGTGFMTTEKRLVIMNTSEYEQSLDLVVVAPDGPIVAYCTCSTNNQEKTGSTDPIATHPNYQRMGLARALLLTGMKLLKERGMVSAHLGTDGKNSAMQRTAEFVGFTITGKTIWFSKEVN